MTKPTQAQIEAAVKALKNMPSFDAYSVGNMEILAKAALTAAAEVDPLDKIQRKYEDAAKAAAAEVGPISSSEQEAYRQGVRDHTIERCAAVVDKYGPTCSDIAAAIRAMKDE